MNFREAADFAKQHPGSVLTRKGDDFVVQLEYGKVISEIAKTQEGAQGYTRSTTGNAYLEMKFSKLSEDLDLLKDRYKHLEFHHDRLKNENAVLKKKLSLVSRYADRWGWQRLVVNEDLTWILKKDQ